MPFYAKGWCEAFFVLRLSCPRDKPLEWMVTRHCAIENRLKYKRMLQDKPLTHAVRQTLSERVKLAPIHFTAASL